jgi:DNA-binding response OmpR family regulator
LLVHPGERAVMLLTAVETLGDRVKGLRIRADQYRPRSFHMLTPVNYRSAER